MVKTFLVALAIILLLIALTFWYVTTLEAKNKKKNTAKKNEVKPYDSTQEMANFIETPDYKVIKTYSRSTRYFT
jgi:spore coat polysaccharide biosynthesis predicted glycosyltransferase SpsG